MKIYIALKFENKNKKDVCYVKEILFSVSKEVAQGYLVAKNIEYDEIFSAEEFEKIFNNKINFEKKIFSLNNNFQYNDIFFNFFK